MTRIDHAAGAQSWIEYSGDQNPDVDERAMHAAALAQAEAVPLAESCRTTVNGARAALSALYDGTVEDGSANMHIRPDIAAALGIEVKS